MPDRLDHRLNLQQHLVVPEPQHAPSLRFKKRRACSIATLRMLATIQLDDHPALDAAEVRDVRRNRMLAPELQSSQLTAA
jgi:hypothetical protein